MEISLEKLGQWIKLQSKDRPVQEESAKQLREILEIRKRETTVEEWEKFSHHLHQKVFDLISSKENNVKIGGILLMDELMDMSTENNEGKIQRFRNYLQMIVDQSSQPSQSDIVLLSTKAVGHLAKCAGPLSTEIVDKTIEHSFVLLRSKIELKRLASMWLLKELAKNVPTLFNQHLSKVINDIWPAIHDSNAKVREAGVLTLRESSFWQNLCASIGKDYKLQ
ncbi:protein kinase, Atypical group [Reticulomyxa filosa]|uniref:Protein kinase, Atypical group n=1 Tax=Reticulomyxa filosa TaxID=46433 RepID=X6P1C6_RETFI|nr:protein kinase, Atypical group [Reticulomyxa filosa]|eukprot:ETO31923.1 protein kinase, Atypical group [Reticulomyxa filosa]